jgi:hypothetical protein
LIGVLLLSSFTLTGISAARSAVCFAWSFTFTAGPGGATGYAEIYDLYTGEVFAYQSVILGPGESRLVVLVAAVPSGHPGAVASIGGGGLTPSVTGPIPVTNCFGGLIGDGRINDGANELGAPLAAYCNSDGGIDVYSISKDTSEGTLAFSASADDIASALDSAASGGASVLVGEGNGDQLWAAPDGTLAVTGPDLNGEGKTYRFDFAGDRCG